jgi:hypothetical protein
VAAREGRRQHAITFPLCRWGCWGDELGVMSSLESALSGCRKGRGGGVKSGGEQALTSLRLIPVMGGLALMCASLWLMASGQRP